MTILLHGRVQNGKMVWRDKEQAQKHVASLEGKRTVTLVEEYPGVRTSNQNRFFHGIVCKYISEATGYEMPETKILLKHMFLTRVGKNGRLYVRETHRLNRAEFAIFIDECVRWAALYLDLVIPEPDTVAEIWEVA